MSLRSFTLYDAINRNARLYGTKTAFLFDGQRVTHANYAERTARLAAGLVAAGVCLGDRVAILAPNSLEYLDLFGAAACLGAIVVPINWRLSAEEVAYVIEDVAPKVLIAADEFKALVPQEGMAGTLRYSLGAALAPWQSVSELYLERDTPMADLPDVADDSGFVIIHTAAVGGRPRGALLSHRGLIAASLLAAASTASVFAQTPIRIGEINSYSAIPQFTQPYKQGWQLLMIRLVLFITAISHLKLQPRKSALQAQPLLQGYLFDQLTRGPVTRLDLGIELVFFFR